MDQFIDAYKLVVLKNYANFEGRLGRGAFWRFVLVNLVISIVLSILAQTFGVVFWLAYVLYAVGVVIPGIAAGARRLHDTNKTAWLLLIGLIPFVGFIVLIVLFAMEGDKQANDHGPVPTDVYDEYA
ncbi:MAG: DUF805 domain-containing protein [Ilumatobacter fluminis]|uniref:DUF805 domain-containing protein n=1 Tax=Ilumatobacter fluminis TaxID=467091 RepID=UPI0032EC03F0